MRIVFFGATELGHRCCRRLLESGEQIVGIFSIPQEFRISYSVTPVRNVTYQGFEDLAQEYDVPLAYVTSGASDTEQLETLRAWKPELGLVIGWYYLVPRSIRSIFSRGVAGIHASLLPKYRGGAPLVWSLINGETETGVTLFYFDDGVDTGDVVAQRAIPIGPDDSIRDVYDRAASASEA
ncbi:MAG: methionyl-tRNA formyltransferase, partial [Gemmatimonadota bacterium]|nr:methionyl-tRNA formyltransferase [Gemmatimonadota bacterium]